MKKLLFFIAVFFFSLNIFCQGLIATHKSLILVYNYPENYFYLEIPGIDKKTTEQQNVFIIDNRLVWVVALNKNKFLSEDNFSKSHIDILIDYILWESKYLISTTNLDIKSTIEVATTKKGKEFAFWTYDMPTQQEEVETDSTTIIPVQKQMFILQLVKDYVVVINTPLIKSDQYDNSKAFLINTIDGIVESNQEIDIEKLSNQVNNQ